MIKNLTITNFKSHQETKISLKNFTLLVGTNSSGKSSIIQALLLLIHNITNSLASPLNGHLVSIGNFTEAGNYVLNQKFITISVDNDDQEVRIKFTEPDEGELDPKCIFEVKSKALEEYLNYKNNRIHYLSANRIGGQDLYTKNFDKYDVFGLNGEFAVDYYESHKEDKLDADLIMDSSRITLDAQLNYWVERIFGQQISTGIISGTDKVKAEYKLPYGRTIRPKNTGSGISYLISILIVCLSSQKGDLIIIENPEIHLHPKAQSTLTEFFTFIANSDRKLIIETHSDHLFNGVKVAVNKNKISSNDLAVHFFTLGADYLSKHYNVEINEDGQVVNAIPDLFDQFSNDLKTLVGF